MKWPMSKPWLRDDRPVNRSSGVGVSVVTGVVRRVIGVVVIPDDATVARTGSTMLRTRSM